MMKHSSSLKHQKYSQKEGRNNFFITLFYAVPTQGHWWEPMSLCGDGIIQGHLVEWFIIQNCRRIDHSTVPFQEVTGIPCNLSPRNQWVVITDINGM